MLLNNSDWSVRYRYPLLIIGWIYVTTFAACGDDDDPACKNGDDCEWIASGLGSATTEGPEVCALRASGTIWCLRHARMERLGTVDGFDQLSTDSAAFIGCARRSDGTAWCWGANDSGQLGDGTTEDRDTPTQVVGLTAVKQVVAGYSRSHAILEDGTVWRWGYGYGSVPVQFEEIDDASVLATSHGHRCIVKGDRTLWCWGANDCGQLGNGTTSVELTDTPTLVSELTEVVSAAVGSLRTCAVTASGEAWCWGRDLFTGTNHLTPEQVPSLSGIREIAVGERHICAVLSAGGIRCWGAGEQGQLGNGSTEDATAPVVVEKLVDVEQVVVRDCFVAAVTATGTLWGWGCLRGNDEDDPYNYLPLQIERTDPGIGQSSEGQQFKYTSLPYPFADPW